MTAGYGARQRPGFSTVHSVSAASSHGAGFARPGEPQGAVMLSPELLNASAESMHAVIWEVVELGLVHTALHAVGSNCAPPAAVESAAAVS